MDIEALWQLLTELTVYFEEPTGQYDAKVFSRVQISGPRMHTQSPIPVFRCVFTYCIALWCIGLSTMSGFTGLNKAAYQCAHQLTTCVWGTVAFFEESNATTQALRLLTSLKHVSVTRIPAVSPRLQPPLICSLHLFVDSLGSHKAQAFGLLPAVLPHRRIVFIESFIV
ncbi:uncharacterized protein CLUP02_08685 [Colletotrichum lupini]|uniref:Uncharacterized protein n=1 Tax=Colletotrichum lupini TaxID=145971 RepID=A0A9Q8STF1_9PEZI|nr:uncharacterized protein CLUP02_08685 [Colletotrichum lupini]UQC83191.1 hypothetical protein CLUP02_08685 [Colletotrichum lupini]